jgi:hypothetical protein
MTIRFNDGMSFDTSGRLRAVRRRDGWYVVGQGRLIPVDSYAEAQAEIALHKEEEAE